MASTERLERRLEAAAAWLYQFAGAADAPVWVLDNLWAMQLGKKPPHKWKYPARCKAVEQLDAIRKAGDDAHSARMDRLEGK